MRFRNAFSQHKIIAYTILFGWIILIIAFLGNVNPVEGSVVSDFITEPLGGLLGLFFAFAALPAITAGYVAVGKSREMLNISGPSFVGLPIFFIAAWAVQTLIYGFVGKILSFIFRKRGTKPA